MNNAIALIALCGVALVFTAGVVWVVGILQTLELGALLDRVGMPTVFLGAGAALLLCAAGLGIAAALRRNLRAKPTT